MSQLTCAEVSAALTQGASVPGVGPDDDDVEILATHIDGCEQCRLLLPPDEARGKVLRFVQPRGITPRVTPLSPDQRAFIDAQVSAAHREGLTNFGEGEATILGVLTDWGRRPMSR